MFLFEVLQADYDVEVAVDGSYAWAVAQLQTPDLILSDIVMPGLDGLGLVRRLRNYPPTAKVPIILMSASGKSDLVVEALQAGADDVLLKPLRMEELMATLATLWQAARANLHPLK